LDEVVVDPYQAAYLDRSIVEMYDHLEQMDVAYGIAELKSEQAQKASDALNTELKRKKRRVERAKELAELEQQREKELLASTLLDSLPFDDVVNESNKFLNQSIFLDEDQIKKEGPGKKSMADRNASAISRII